MPARAASIKPAATTAAMPIAARSPACVGREGDARVVGDGPGDERQRDARDEHEPDPPRPAGRSEQADAADDHTDEDREAAEQEDVDECAIGGGARGRELGGSADRHDREARPHEAPGEGRRPDDRENEEPGTEQHESDGSVRLPSPSPPTLIEPPLTPTTSVTASRAAAAATSAPPIRERDTGDPPGE